MAETRRPIPHYPVVAPKRGDKLRIRGGRHSGRRALLLGTAGRRIRVQLESGAVITLSTRTPITNFSLAARRAWQVMPKRAGRRAQETPRSRMLSIRFDRALLARLDRAVAEGAASSRSQAIEEWVQRGVEAHESENAATTRSELVLIRGGEPLPLRTGQPGLKRGAG